MDTDSPRVAEQLEDLLAEPAGVVSDADLRELRAHLESSAGRAVDLLDGHDRADRLPLRVPKARVAALSVCERHAVARHAAPYEPSMTPAALRGVALDRYVLHELVLGPVAEPVEDLLSMLDAEGEFSLRDDVIAMDSEHGGVAVLAPLASAARVWSGLDASWWPRTQTAAVAHLAGGRVVVAGRVDVELGGPLADRPGVVVEVKSGAPRMEHLAEVTLYALLVALRDGRAPGLAARWYPGGALAHVVITADVLWSAARRLGDAVGVWAELQAGRPPTETPGPWCSWCPAADQCPSAVPPLDPLAELDAAWESEQDEWASTEGAGAGRSGGRG